MNKPSKNMDWVEKFDNKFTYVIPSTGKRNITRSDPWLVKHIHEFISSLLQEQKEKILLGYLDRELDSPGIDNYIKKTVKHAQKQERNKIVEEIIEIIKSQSPSLVCPVDYPPFREDYINKYNLIDILNKIKEV